MAERKVISGSTPNATPPPSEIDASPRLPLRKSWLSAEKPSSRPFWMMIDSPNVTSKRRQQIAPERAVEQEMLEREADAEHQRHCEQGSLRTDRA